MQIESRRGIDIIIPIYNAYDDLCACYDSILRYTNLELDRVIMINDNSPDERIADFFNGIEHDGIICLTNKYNRGFSNNVNMGMLYSTDRDVILLNSDTVVTDRWVDKLYTCAYSKEEIGTVTPLSNSATLCSVPNMCQDNPLPEGLSVDDMAEIIDRVSLCDYPRITVAVGFCMYIKRKVIEDVGLFDAKTFERGYGEENDFCNRAEQLGYIHVMCDNVFIYHKGMASFHSENRRQLVEEHDKILNSRYPEQMRKNHLYCINNPDQYIRDNIAPHIVLKNGRKNLLYMVHLDFREDAIGHVGGTQLHVRDLVEGGKDEYNIFVVARDGEYLRLTAYVENAQLSYVYYIGVAPEYFMFHNQVLKKLFDSILDEFLIDIVHIHHVDTLSLDMYYCACERNIPIISTVHDFYCICPNVKLINCDKIYCGAMCDKDYEKKCLKFTKNIAVTTDYLSKWRNEFRIALALSRVIITPSVSAKEIVINVYPELASSMRVIEHGTELDTQELVDVDIKDAVVENNELQVYVENLNNIDNKCVVINGWAVWKEKDNQYVNVYLAAYDDRKLLTVVKAEKAARIDVAKAFDDINYKMSGVSGKLFSDKGNIKQVRVFFECDNILKEYGESFCIEDKILGERNKTRIAFVGGITYEKGGEIAGKMIRLAPMDMYEWYIIGEIGEKQLSDIDQENMHVIGAYQKSELKRLMQVLDIDLVCILSVWPETFCYTLSEAILCGIPVLALDIGAVSERIKRHKYGWLVDRTADENQILEKIKAIMSDKQEYDCVRRIVLNHTERNNGEMCRDYKEIYAQCITEEVIRKKPDTKLIYQGLLGKKKAIETTPITEIKRALRDKEQELQSIKNSRTYKAAKALSSKLRRIHE